MKRKRKHRFLKILLSVVFLAAVSLTAVKLINGRGNLSIDDFKRFFGSVAGTPAVSEFAFDSGFNNVFADLDGCFAVASTVGIQVFDEAGNKVYTEIYEMTNPTITACGGIGAAYDLGGRALKVFDGAGILGSLTADAGIISASLNDTGYLTVCTQAGSGHKAYVYIYGAGDYKNYLYLWKSGGGYVVSAALTPDGRTLAVLTLTGDGTRIVFFSLGSGSMEEKGSCTLRGKLAMKLRILDDARALAVCDDALVLAGADGRSQVLADYSDKHLADFSLEGEGFAALALSDYMVGDRGRILTLDHNGNTLGTLETRRRIVSVSARGDYLAVLYGDGFVIYDKYLYECGQFEETAGVVQTIMRSDRTALLITSHSASVFNMR